jgi:hypothetical protein
MEAVLLISLGFGFNIGVSRVGTGWSATPLVCSFLSRIISSGTCDTSQRAECRCKVQTKAVSWQAVSMAWNRPVLNTFQCYPWLALYSHRHHNIQASSDPFGSRTALASEGYVDHHIIQYTRRSDFNQYVCSIVRTEA